MEAIDRYCTFVRECPGLSTTDDTIVVLEHLAAARRNAALLIGASADEIALVESTQHGLSVVAQLLDLKRGDRVVATDIEFFGTLLPWRHLERTGIEIDLVPNREGRVEAADLSAAIGPRTRAVVVSSVQETNGYAVDLEALSSACRDKGVHLIVDGAQHVGPVVLDVGRTPVDAVAVGGHKWLCCPYGLGFLYVRRELLETFEARSPGYMAVEEPAQGWARYLEDPSTHPADDFKFVRDARKLELAGTGPYLAAAALSACLAVILQLGRDAIASRVHELVKTLTSELAAAGMAVTSALEPEAMSGIVCFQVPGGLEQQRRVVARLAAAGVAVSLRFTSGVGGIRVSPYFYNDESDLDRLLSAVTARD